MLKTKTPRVVEYKRTRNGRIRKNIREVYAGDPPQEVDSTEIELDESRSRLMDGSIRENVFEAHWSPYECEKALANGEALKGKVRMARTTCMVGFVDVFPPGSLPNSAHPDKTILILGSQNLNRSIDGDDVIIVETVSDEDQEAFVPEGDGDDKLVHVIEMERVRITGKVVSIVKRNNPNIVGTFKPLADDQFAERKLDRILIPIDRRYPRVVVRARNSGVLENRRVVAKVDSWTRCNHLPSGYWVDVVEGRCFEEDTEMEAIRKSYGIISRPFPKAVMDLMPKATFEITEEEISNRHDLRNEFVITIDGDTTISMDDALSIRQLPDGNVNLGVHIADASYFVREGTPPDIEARERFATSYFPQGKIDMVPEVLSNHLLSIKAGLDRLTVSVVWTLTPKGEVVDVNFYRSVVRSKHKLTYKEANAIIKDGQNTSKLGKTLRSLYETSTGFLNSQMRHVLELNPPEIDVNQMEDSGPSMETVRACMIMANASVAQRISGEPSLAIIRHQEPPDKERLESLFNRVSALYNVDSPLNKDAAVTTQSLTSYIETVNQRISKMHSDIIQLMLIRCMNRGRYSVFETIENTSHFALDFPLYGGFTSPIRNYAHLATHRLLLSILEGTVETEFNLHRLDALCSHMNETNQKLRESGRVVTAFKIYQLLKPMGEIQNVVGIVVDVKSNGVEVYCPKYRIICICPLPRHLFDYDRVNKVLVPVDAEVRKEREKDMEAPPLVNINSELQLFDYVYGSLFPSTDLQRWRIEFIFESKMDRPPTPLELQEEVNSILSRQ